MIRLQILIENTSKNCPELESEHGLSIFVETPKKIFLFDCGHTGLAWKNAARLGVDLTQIDFVVLSHAHYDHAGGFPALLNHVVPREIYTGENFWSEKFSRAEGSYKYRGAGFTAADLKNWGVVQKICRDVLEIDENIFLVGNFERRHDFETIPEKFVRGAEKIPDTFDDEICLALREGDGVAVVVGCSHAGILNIVETVRARLNLPIKSVIGGIHLADASDERIAKTLAGLKNFGVGRLALCHCSGEKVRADFLTTGSVLEI